MLRCTDRDSTWKEIFCSDTFMVMLIIVFSLTIMSIVTFANPNSFLADDNILQWEPIIKKSFDTFFSEGYIPYIDFYQYKMFNILDVGYYSLNNPVMLIAYVLGRFVFASRIGTVCIYVYIMFALGNTAMYLLLRRLNISKTNTWLAVLAFSAVSYFIFYGFYYFTFNNYFFIPFLLLVILYFDKSKFGYFAAGICLAFSLLLGQVQYTFYYYMVYAIVMLVISFVSNRRYLMLMLTNIVAAVILSAPQLLVLVLISGNRSQIIGTASSFLQLPIFEPGMLVFFAIPLYLIGGTYQMIRAGGALREELNYLTYCFVYLGALLPLYALFISVFFKKTLCVIHDALKSGSVKLNKKAGTKNENIFVGTFCYLSICFLPIWIESRSSIDFLPKLIYSVEVAVVFALIFTLLSLRNEAEKWQKWIIVVLMIYYPFVTAAIAMFFFIHEKIRSGNAFPRFDRANSDINADSFNYYIAVSSAVASIFFVLFSMGESGIIAIVLSKIPIINSFRFLYKCAFVFIPLMVIPAAYALNNIKKKRRIVIISIVVLSIIGISNSCYMINSGLHTYINNKRYPYNNGTDYVARVSSRIDEIGADRNNYRFLAITEGGESFEEGSYIESSSVDFCDKMTKNMSTMVGVFTLAGYDNAFTKVSYDQSNLILSDIYYNNMFTNAVNGHGTFSKLANLAENDPQLRAFYRQLNDNAVKYFLFDKDATKSLDAFKRLCDKLPEVSIVREVNFVNDTVVIEIDGVDSLCKTDTGISIPLNSKMAELNFNLSDEPTEYITLSFTYNENYKAVLITPDGTEKELDVVGDDSDYTRVNTQNSGSGTVTLYYDNPLDNLVMAFSALTCILLIWIIAIMFIRRKR